jgi:hypothetical protein
MKNELIGPILIILCVHLFLWPVMATILFCKTQNKKMNMWHTIHFVEIIVYMIISYPIIVGILLVLLRLNRTI